MSQFLFCQQVTQYRTATLNNGDYSLEGTVRLEVLEDNSIQLKFEEDYLTQSNVFDVHVFLTNDNNYAAPIDTTGMLLIANIGSIDGLDYSSGERTFDLPSTVEINDYQHIVFVCVRFGRLHWGDGTFSDVTINSPAGLEKAFNEVMKNYEKYDCDMKTAAMITSIRKLEAAMKLRGLFPG